MNLAILGASGHGKVVAEIAELNGYSSIEFYDDRFPGVSELAKWQVVGTLEDFFNKQEQGSVAVVAIGNNTARQQIQKRIITPVNPLIHPSAVLSDSSAIGQGTVVMAGAIINADSKIGAGVIINTAAVVDHDCFIADFSHISPKAALAGGVIVGSCAWVGIGANVKQLISIGHNAVVGVGSAVVRDVPDCTTVVGVPAKVLQTKPASS